MTPGELRQQLGAIDIYFLDQILRGRVSPGTRLLDAGCGEGRNLHFLMQSRADVHGIDRRAAAIDELRDAAAPYYADAIERFRAGEVDALPWPDAEFDVVICNAVLHFSDSTEHFNAMLAEMGRVLKRGGLFFARLMTTIGMEGRTTHLGDNRHRLPAGLEAFLATEEMLLDRTAGTLRGDLADPLKSTLVEHQRSMTTWVVRKSPAG